MYDYDIKISTKLCQIQCPQHIHHIQISVDDVSNLFFLKAIE